MNPKTASDWLALAPIVVGVVGLLGLATVWILTGRESALLVTTFTSLLVGGQGAQIIVALRKPPGGNQWDGS